MRLTHKAEYKDKRKNKEPMLRIRNKLFELEYLMEKYGFENVEDLDNFLQSCIARMEFENRKRPL